MPVQDIITELEIGLRSMVGKKCWGTFGGYGTGSRFVISCGAYVKDPDMMLRSELLLESDPVVNGEYGLFIECAWRIDSAHEVLVSGQALLMRGSTEFNMQAIEATQVLVGREITGCSLGHPGLDMNLEFGEDLTLRIFCDQTRDDDNYTLFAREDAFVVGERSILRREYRPIEYVRR